MHTPLGAVLVGGQSTRMGRDKATLRLKDGRTMVDIVAATLLDVCRSIVTVGTREQDSIGVDVPHLVDGRSHTGPLAGIEALLASNLAAEYLVCPCDLPRMTPQVLRMLCDASHSQATVLRIAGQADFEPLPARISASALPIVRRLLNQNARSVFALMRELDPSIVEVDAHFAEALMNVNTPEDLSML